jgi:hypothetical protein
MMLFQQDDSNLTHDAVVDRAQREIRTYSVGLLCDQALSGAGTLVQWDGEFGILTAGHVAEAITRQGRSRLTIPLTDTSHSFGFACSTLGLVASTYIKADPQGPDIGLVRLPPSTDLDTLKAKKSFLNLNVNIDRKLKYASSNNSISIIFGSPAEYSSMLNRSHHGFDDVKVAPSVIFQVILERRSHRKGFDYIRTRASVKEMLRVRTLKGVSGGGLWRTVLTKGTQQERYHYHGVALAGVAYYERPEGTDGTRVVECHGPESIFVNLLDQSRASATV